MPEEGQIFDGWCVQRELGRGTSASLYVVQRSDGRQAALKVLHTVDERSKNRLLEEGRSLAKVKHPNVVRIARIFEVEGRPALLLELVLGPTLAEWLDRYRPDPQEALQVFRGVARGVAALHAEGLVHRDLNPSNILLAAGAQGSVVPKLVDLGLVLARDRTNSNIETLHGSILGTPGYIAPEQMLFPGAVDERADLFSLGAILYELVSGEKAFVEPSLKELLEAARTGKYTPLTRAAPAVDPYLEDVVDKLLAPSPEHRYPDVDTMLVQIYLDDVPALNADFEDDGWSVGKVSTAAGAAARAFVAPKKGPQGPVGGVDYGQIALGGGIVLVAVLVALTILALA